MKKEEKFSHCSYAIASSQQQIKASETNNSTYNTVVLIICWGLF